MKAKNRSLVSTRVRQLCFLGLLGLIVGFAAAFLFPRPPKETGQAAAKESRKVEESKSRKVEKPESEKVVAAAKDAEAPGALEKTGVAAAAQPYAAEAASAAKAGSAPPQQGRSTEAPKKVLLRTVHGQVDLSAKNPFKHIPEDYRSQPPEGEKQAALYLVQFGKPITKKMKTALRQAGGEIHGYLPDYTFVVKATPPQVRELEEIPEVEAVVPRPPFFSVSPRLLTILQDGQPNEEETIIACGFNIRRPPGKGNLKAAGFPVDDKTRAPAEFTPLTATRKEILSFLPKLVARSDVGWVQKYYLLRPISLESEGTGLVPANAIAAPVIQSGAGTTPIWDAGITGTDQIVCVTDSGLDADHLMFYDSVELLIPRDTVNTNQRKVIAYYDVHSWGALNPYDYDPFYGTYHGTHVAGTVAGKFFASTNDQGMAPAAKLVINDAGDYWPLMYGTEQVVIIFDSYDDLFLYPPAVNSAFISSNSWGAFPSPSTYTADAAIIDGYVYTDERDLLILFAAGNYGEWGANTISLQANAKNALVVGASGDGSLTVVGNSHRAIFSSLGPAGDGRIRPHVMAPGYVVKSAAGDGSTTPGAGNSGLKTMGGTSMATPAVAGAAALVREYFEEGYYPTGGDVPADALTPSGALLKAMLINSGKDMDGGINVLAHIPDNSQGWGRVTLDDVLFFSGDARKLIVFDEDTALGAGQSRKYCFEVTDAGEELRVTVVWTDPPTSLPASIALVNNLDLTVKIPSTTVYKGNVFWNGFSATAGAADALNNEECVYLQTPALGIYEITVAGFNIPLGTQDYALVVTGGVVAVPEIKVLGNSLEIVDGDTTPSTADNTEYGFVELIDTVTHTFLIANLGTADLTLTGVPKVEITGLHAVDFTVPVQPTSPVIPGAGISFDVEFDPSAINLREATVNIVNNDGDENPYTFDIQGTGGTPEMDLTGNGAPIPDGSPTPSLVNHTDFGDALVAGGTVVRTFTIANPGTADLVISITGISGTHSTDFSVTSSPGSPVAPLGSTTLGVTFAPSAPGIRSAVISITSNDPVKSPYDFAIQGTGRKPEMKVTGNTVEIDDGDITPTTADHTDFGGVLVAGGLRTRTFTIDNLGNSDLALTGAPLVAVSGAHAADFIVTVDPTSPVLPLGSTTFDVEFDPDGGGVRSATISIENDDSDENPYDFAIQGTGTVPRKSSGGGCALSAGPWTPGEAFGWYLPFAMLIGSLCCRRLTRRRPNER